MVFTHDDIQFKCDGINTTNTCTVENTCSNASFSDRTDMSPGQKTYVSEYGLVCESRHYASLAVSLMFFGVLSTSPFNYVSDLYGRKRIMLISCIAQGVFVLLASFSPWHLLYGISLYLNGFFGGLKYKAAAVLISESVTMNHRDNAGTFLMIGFCAGYALLAPFAYLFPAWRELTKYISIVSFVAAGVIHFFVLESTVWLIGKGRYEEAEDNVKKLAPEKVQQQIFENLKDTYISHTPGDNDEDNQTDSALDNLKQLVSKKILQSRLVIMGYIWFATSVLFRSFALGTSDLEGSPYMNLIYSAAFDVLACFISLGLLKIIGRRAGITLCFFVCAACTAACAAFSPDWLNNPNMVRYFALISKLGFLGTHNINYIYTPELFPLSVRSTAMGAVGILDGLGAVIAPFFLDYRNTNQEMQYIIQTVTAGVAGILAMAMLPETSQFKLPVTDEDLEEAEKTRLFRVKKRRGSPEMEEEDSELMKLDG